MQTFIKAIKSRTVWTIVVMFLVGGVEAIGGVIPEGVYTPVMLLLGALATYFKLNPSQRY